MDDIKRRSQSSQSKRVHQAPLLRAHQRDLYKKVEEFESDEYDTDNEEVQEGGNDIRSYYNNRREEVRKPIKISKFSFLSFLIFVLLVVGILLFTFIFNSASIKITPRVYSFSVDTEIKASSSSVGNFSSVTATTKKTLDRSEKKKVQSKASGEIVIYNNYSENTQKLVKSTRFEAPNGIIFRITDSVVVPGKSGNTPGSVIAKVTADSFGENYNIKPSKFTVPGFKNSPRYTAFYAESKTAMTGGVDGDRYVVSGDAIALADTGMQNTLKSELMKSVMDQKLPDGYAYATNTVYIVYSNNLEEFEAGKVESYEVTGTANVFLINKKALSEVIAKASMSNYNANTGYRVSDYVGVNISPKTDLQKDDTLTVKGKGLIVYDVDFEKVKRDLLGKSEDEYSGILSKFSSVEKADISIRPFWINTFPDDVNKLKIIELLP